MIWIILYILIAYVAGIALMFTVFGYHNWWCKTILVLSSPIWITAIPLGIATLLFGSPVISLDIYRERQDRKLRKLTSHAQKLKRSGNNI